MVATGLAPNTLRTYTTAISRYMEYCVAYQLDPFDLSEWNIVRYVAYLASRGLKATSVQVYLSGLRTWCVLEGLPTPNVTSHRIKLAIRSVHRTDPPPRRASPFLHHMLCRSMDLLLPTYDNLVFIAALSLGFFGCLRASEFVVASDSSPILRSDIEFLDTDPRAVMVHIRKSKTSPHGFFLPLGCADTRTCPVCILWYLITMYPAPRHTPLFRFQDGRLLTYNNLSVTLKKLVSRMGFDPVLYSPHSIRAGAATTAVMVGFTSAELRQLGRWHSAAHLLYFRPNPTQLSFLTARLAADTSGFQASHQ